MKTILKILLPVSLLALLVAAADKPAGRIATIDLKRTFEKYYLHDTALKAVDQEAADIDKKLKAMQDEGQKIVDERNKLARDISDPMITPQERDAIRTKMDAKAQEIAAKQNEIRTYGLRSQEELDVRTQRIREQLLKEIRAAVDAKAKAAGYSMVVDTSAVNQLGSPYVVFSNGENDITEEILKQINAAAPVSAPPDDPVKTAEKPADKSGKK